MMYHLWPDELQHGAENPSNYVRKKQIQHQSTNTHGGKSNQIHIQINRPIRFNVHVCKGRYSPNTCSGSQCHNLLQTQDLWFIFYLFIQRRQQQSKRQEFSRQAKSQTSVNLCCASQRLSVLHAELLVGHRNTTPSVYKESHPRWLLILWIRNIRTHRGSRLHI